MVAYGTGNMTEILRILTSLDRSIPRKAGSERGPILTRICAVARGRGRGLRRVMRQLRPSNCSKIALQ